MQNFNSLSREEYNRVWDNFYDLYKFKPSINEFPAVRTDLPYLKFDITNGFISTFPMNELEEAALKLFCSLTIPNDRLYALDWKHTCYDFDPRIPVERDEFDEWTVPIFPNGDYYIFLTKDFSNVWVGHPWEKTITLIGQEIVENGHDLNRFFKIIKSQRTTKHLR